MENISKIHCLHLQHSNCVQKVNQNNEAAKFSPEKFEKKIIFVIVDLLKCRHYQTCGCMEQIKNELFATWATHLFKPQFLYL
jgi:hypothetical protein